jgi:hypothetical protein
MIDRSDVVTYICIAMSYVASEPESRFYYSKLVSIVSSLEQAWAKMIFR